MLFTVERYCQLTGDSTTGYQVVSACIERAIDELEEEVLDRPLDLAERTERMIPDRRGRLWPKATPIVDAAGYTIDGYALLSSWPYAGRSIVAPMAAGVDVTYTGGWTAETLPRCIERDLAAATYLLAHPPAADAIGIDTTGALSVRVGDVAVTYGPKGAPGTSLSDRLAAVWSRRTLAYRYSLPTGVGRCP